MKKTLALLLALAMLTALCACGDSSTAASTETPAPVTETPAPPTETPVPPTETPAPVWTKAFYLDPFETPTEDYYLGTSAPVEGSYNSVSVTKGALKAELRVDAEKLCVYLFEDGDKQVKNGGQEAISCPVSVKKADGGVLQAEGILPSGGDCVVIPEEQARILLSGGDPSMKENSIAAALCAEGGEISFYITREDQPATNYLFSVSCDNFAALYEAEIALPIRMAAYAEAEALLAAEDYDGAIAAFSALGDYSDSAQRVDQSLEAKNAAAYADAEALLAVEDYDGAIAAFTALGDYSDSAQRAEQVEQSWAEVQARFSAEWDTIAAGLSHTVGLRADGTVLAVGWNDSGRCEVSDWTNIVAVAAGLYHTVGLRADGTVLAVGRNDYGQCEVSGWTDVVAIAAGGYHTVGLRADGTVVAVGLNDHGQCQVSDWTDIVAIAAGGYHTVGLRADGTVVATKYTGDYYYGQGDVSGWTNIVAIAAGSRHTVGLRADGTVVAVGSHVFGPCEVSDWTDIVAIAAGGDYTVGLRADGTVLAVGWNDDGQCEVSGWTDIVAIAADDWHTVGLRADGTVVAVGDNDHGQCEVSGWTDIMIPSAAKLSGR